jgi:hypothetical protein
LSEKVLHRHLHDQIPDTFPVVEDARVLFLFLCAIEEAARKGDHKVFEDPLEQSPEHEIVLVHEILGFVL